MEVPLLFKLNIFGLSCEIALDVTESFLCFENFQLQFNITDFLNPF